MNPTASTYTLSTSAYRWLVFCTCWLSGIFAGLNANLFAVFLPQTLTEILGTSDRTLMGQTGAYILSSFLLGWMLGGIAMGILSDRYGRVKAMAFSIGLYTTFTALIALSQTTWHLMFFRFMAGMGIGGTMLSISIFLAETWPSKSRALAIGALITSYQVGVFLSGLVAQLLPEWRTAFACGIAPLFLVMIIMRFFHEPAQWLNSQQAIGKPSSFSTKKNLWIGGITFGSLLIGYWASVFWIPTWIQDLLGATAQGYEKNIATVGHGLGAILGCFCTGFLADRWGRRPVIMLSYGGAFLVSWLMFATNMTFSPAIYWQNTLLGFCAGMAQAVMYVYLPELFPTRTRAACMGICLNGGRFVTAIAVLFMGVFVWFFGGYREALCVFASIYVLGLGFAYLGPETKHQELLN